LSLFSLLQFEEAAIYLRKAQSINPKNVSAIIGLASIFFSSGKNKDAV
jgi:Flp pilus assembly protein TadD